MEEQDKALQWLGKAGMFRASCLFDQRDKLHLYTYDDPSLGRNFLFSHGVPIHSALAWNHLPNQGA